MAHRYNVSKLLEVLVVRALAERMTRRNMHVVLNTLTPGFTRSEIARENYGLGIKIAYAVMARKTDVGARTLVSAACAGPKSHGGYMADGEVVEDGRSTGVSKFVRSEEGRMVQERVWAELKAKLEGIKPGITGVVD